MERRANCRCEKPPTADANKSQTDWYKEIYSRMHVLPESKKDTQINPYQPTYKFPKEFDGNLQLMEDYIRKMASQNLDEDDEPTQSSSPITNVKDCRTTAMKTHEKYSHYSSPIDQIKLQPNTIVAPTSHSSKPTNNNEQRSIYKRILRGGEIPMAGLQKFIGNNHDKPVQQASESASISTENVDQIRGQNPSINERQHFSSVDDDRRSKTNSPIYKAVALHNFYAQSNRELSFKKGDTFPVKRRINDNWLEGEHQGVIGIFPSNHVELFPIDTKESNNNHGEAIVKYDFIPQNHFELQLQKGEKVILLRRLNNNWYKGRSNNFEGIFPAGYVETLREPTDNLNSTFSFDSDRENQSDRSSENDSRIRSPLTMSSVKPKSVLKSSKSTVDRLDRSSESPAPMRKCQVLYDYLPQNSDELEIHVGDIITIVEMCDDGWYCGLMEKSKFANKMEFGTFPGNYVKILSGNS